MNFGKYFLENIVGFAIELVKLLPIMIFVFDFKVQSTKITVISGLGAAVLLIISAVFGITQYGSVYTYISVLLTLFIVKGNNRIIYTMISSLGVGILDMLTATVWLLFHDNSYVQLTDDTVNHMAINAISIAAIFIICMIAKAFLLRQKHIMPQKAGKSYLILLVLGEISLFMFITAFQLNEDLSNNKEKVMAVCLSIGSVVFLLTSIILLVTHISQNHFKSISQISEKLIKSQERYYTMLLKKDEETRKFRHDINNHLNCMRLLFENKKYDELESYFNKIGASILELRPELQIGNDLISAILKDTADKHSDVSVDIIGKLPSSIRLDNTDVCTIFYNLFENAFAAAEAAEEKSVEIFVKLLGENLFFTIKNTVLRKVEIENNILKTDKQDKERHGFGSENAMMCAEKNGGALTYKCSDTHFEAELILPNIN